MSHCRIVYLFLLLVMLLVPGALTPAQVQTEGSTKEARIITHNTWSTTVRPMPTPVASPVTTVFQGHIYVLGGDTASGVTAGIQIYDPKTNSWSSTSSISLPVPLRGAHVAVLGRLLYVIGGQTNTGAYSNTVYAYNAVAKTWSTKTQMPSARCCGGAVIVKNASAQNIIYVLGGFNGAGLGTVESYDPINDSWAEETPMDQAKDQFAFGVSGGLIFTADGSPGVDEFTGDTESYNPSSNTWQGLTADPNSRTGVCGGVIGAKLYSAGGNPDAPTASSLTESFTPSNKKKPWITTLEAMPQPTMYGSSVVYGGKLYCLGGEAESDGSYLNIVQVYQP